MNKRENEQTYKHIHTPFPSQCLTVTQSQILYTDRHTRKKRREKEKYREASNLRIEHICVYELRYERSNKKFTEETNINGNEMDVYIREARAAHTQPVYGRSEKANTRCYTDCVCCVFHCIHSYPSYRKKREREDKKAATTKTASIKNRRTVEPTQIDRRLRFIVFRFEHFTRKFQLESKSNPGRT